MIKVDIAEIEKLTDVLVRAASGTEEVLGRLRQISQEMYDDVELPIYPQSTIALDAVSGALDALNRGNDTLQSLKNVISHVVETYQEAEMRNKAALSRMSVIMDSVAVGYNAAIVSAGIAHIEHTESVVAQGEVQRLVADSVEEMQVANIAAVTRVVMDEYEISKIEELIKKS